MLLYYDLRRAMQGDLSARNSSSEALITDSHQAPFVEQAAMSPSSPQHTAINHSNPRLSFEASRIKADLL